MRAWRVSAVGLAVLAFVLAAFRPDGVVLFATAGGPGLRLGRVVFFWIGVALSLAAAWGRGT